MRRYTSKEILVDVPLIIQCRVIADINVEIGKQNNKQPEYDIVIKECEPLWPDGMGYLNRHKGMLVWLWNTIQNMRFDIEAQVIEEMKKDK